LGPSSNGLSAQAAVQASGFFLRRHGEKSKQSL